MSRSRLLLLGSLAALGALVVVGVFGLGQAGEFVKRIAPNNAENPPAASASGGGVTAQRAEPPMPEPRQESATAVLSGKLFVLAGFDSVGHDTSSVFIFDGTSWLRGASLPAALNHPSAAVANGRLYVAGGFSNGNASAKTFVLAPSGDSWQPAQSMLHARGAMALVGIGNQLFALGGKNGNTEVPSAEVFDSDSQVWRELPQFPNPRDHVAGFAYQGMPCAAGGRTSTNTSRVDCFDSGKATWRQLSDLPVPTSGAGATALGNDVMVVGGEPVGGTGPNVAVLARLVNGSWRTSTMTLPRHGLQLAVLNGRAWACGGGSSPGLKPVSDCTSIQ